MCQMLSGAGNEAVNKTDSQPLQHLDSSEETGLNSSEETDTSEPIVKARDGMEPVLCHQLSRQGKCPEAREGSFVLRGGENAVTESNGGKSGLLMGSHWRAVICL